MPMAMIEVRAHDGPAQALPEEFTAQLSPMQVRAAAGRLGRALGERRSVDLNGLDAAATAAFVEGLLLGGYSVRVGRPARAVVVHAAGAPDAIADGARSAAAVIWARELSNTRAAELSPQELARRAGDLAADGVRVSVRDENWLAEQGFGGVLAVGGGSATPPRLIQAGWQPRHAVPGQHLILVGKGITFDTGGLNLKPVASMRSMYTDMSGGAAVLGALRLIAQRNLPVRVTALVPSAENCFGGGSMRPSDVVRHYGGRTSEIGNTDAEGRIVLADALAYAVARLAPTALVSIATLTGAAKVALGLRTAGLLSSDDTQAAQLLAAGQASGEPVWRLPLAEDYAELLSSGIADATNSPGAPGAITAALFLRPFTGGLPWAHLDVAGPARADKDDGLLSRGGTGYGVRLLTEWVSARARTDQPSSV
jgi:leucyl aminopeptidase